MTLSVDAIDVTETTNPAAALEALQQRAPYAGEIVRAFGALALERAECKAALQTDEHVDMACDPEQFAQGTPLLSGVNMLAFHKMYHQSAKCMLPAMEQLFPSISPALGSLRRALADNPGLLGRLLNVLTDDGDVALKTLVDELHVDGETLVFAVREIVKTGLQRQAETLAPLIAEMPWSKGYCPICGAQPDLAFMRPKEPEPSEFLVSKSGQFWLHCSLCAHRWRFVRSKCPHCDITDHKKLEYFSTPDHEDERIYACSQCHHYVLCVDLTNRNAFTDLNLEPLALIHLDFLAQEKGFKPLVELPWNQFSDSSRPA